MICRRTALLAALESVIPAITDKPRIPALASTMLEWSGDEAFLTGSNEVRWIKRRIVGATPSAPNGVLLPPRRLKAVLSSSTADDVEISVNGDVVVKAGTSSFRFAQPDASSWPPAPDLQSPVSSALDGGWLASALTFGAMSVSRLSSEVETSSVHLAHGWIGSTDQKSVAGVLGLPSALDGGWMIPAASARMLAAEAQLSSSATLSIDEHVLELQTERATVRTALVSKKRPPIERVLGAPTEGVDIAINPDAWLRVLRQADAFATKESASMWLKFTDQHVDVSITTPVGSFDQYVMLDDDVPTSEFIFRPSVLIPPIAALRKSDGLSLTVPTASHKKLYIKGADGQRFVAMPIDPQRASL